MGNVILAPIWRLKFWTTSNKHHALRSRCIHKHHKHVVLTLRNSGQAVPEYEWISGSLRLAFSPGWLQPFVEPYVQSDDMIYFLTYIVYQIVYKLYVALQAGRQSRRS